MANLTETPTWEDGIYKWADGDPLDGDTGHDALPIQQLANRTAWLKAQGDALIAAADLEPEPSDLSQLLSAVLLLCGGFAGSVGKTTQQTLVSTIPQQLTFDVAEYGTDAWDAANNRFIAPMPGVYEVKANAIFLSPTPPSSCYLEVWKNGVLYKRGVEVISAGTLNLSTPVNVDVPLAAGDYVEIWAKCYGDGPTVGVAPDYTPSGDHYTYFQIHMVGKG